jgi:hypothetical protein
MVTVLMGLGCDVVGPEALKIMLQSAPLTEEFEVLLFRLCSVGNLYAFYQPGQVLLLRSCTYPKGDTFVGWACGTSLRPTVETTDRFKEDGAAWQGEMSASGTHTALVSLCEDAAEWEGLLRIFRYVHGELRYGIRRMNHDGPKWGEVAGIDAVRFVREILRDCARLQVTLPDTLYPHGSGRNFPSMEAAHDVAMFRMPGRARSIPLLQDLLLLNPETVLEGIVAKELLQLVLRMPAQMRRNVDIQEDKDFRYLVLRDCGVPEVNGVYALGKEGKRRVRADGSNEVWEQIGGDHIIHWEDVCWNLTKHRTACICKNAGELDSCENTPAWVSTNARDRTPKTVFVTGEHGGTRMRLTMKEALLVGGETKALLQCYGEHSLLYFLLLFAIYNRSNSDFRDAALRLVVDFCAQWPAGDEPMQYHMSALGMTAEAEREVEAKAKTVATTEAKAKTEAAAALRLLSTYLIAMGLKLINPDFFERLAVHAPDVLKSLMSQDSDLTLVPTVRGADIPGAHAYAHVHTHTDAYSHARAHTYIQTDI